MPLAVSFDEHRRRAEDHRSSGRKLEAATEYGRALEADPGSQSVWVQYAHMLKDGGFLEEAVYAYRRAIARDGTSPDPWLHLAHLLKRMNRVADAIEAFRALRALPDGPVVDHEIAGLSIALLGGTVARHDEAHRPAGPVAEACRAGWQRLRASEAIAMDRETAASVAPPVQGGRRRWKDLYAPPETLPSHLQPMRNLVIRDGVFVATTEDPQFSIDLDSVRVDDVLVEAAAIHAGWFEMTVRIADALQPPHPVLYVEQRAPWARFTTHRLAAIGKDLFGVVVRIEAPTGRLRLDPMAFEGPFTGGEFTLRKLSIACVLKRAYRTDGPALLRTVLALARHRSIAHVERDIAGLLAHPHPDRYRLWVEARERVAPADPLHVADRLPADVIRQPSIRIVMDARDAGVSDAAAAIRSLRCQLYDNWAVDIIGPASRKAILEDRLVQDPRIRVLPVTDLSAVPVDGEPDNGPDFYLTMGVVHRLAPTLLSDLAAYIRTHRGKRLIYGDSDSIGADGHRHSPLFRPDWNEDYCLTGHFIGNVALVEATVYRAAAVAAAPDAANLYPFILQLAERLRPDEIGHIADILYHAAGEERGGSPAGGKAHQDDSNRVALQASLDRRGLKGNVTEGLNGYRRIVWALPSPPPAVTLIIPTRDHADLLSACIASLRERTTYADLDILIVDNDSADSETFRLFDRLSADSRIRILPVPGPFNFSRLNNLAVAQARGSVVGLVNNDIVAIHADWLDEMVSQAVRPHVGAVGAKLLYESGHIQHAGIVCGIGSVAGHGHKYAPGDAVGYMGRLACTQAVSAVTAACLVVEKAKYLAVGGLDEENLQVAFNDVDLCLKLDAIGLRTVFTPHARLYHRESVSRGFDTSPEKAKRYEAEAAFMMQRWGDRLRIDPYYNVNLTREREDFSV